ncbi:hypothetical protein BDW75DRAFT_210802 [Aspergillus navahoensis]
MLSIRKTNQGRYRSEYSRLQREAESMAPNQGSVPVQNSDSTVLSATPTIYPVYLAATEDDRVRVTCTLLGGEDCRTGKLGEIDVCVLKFLTSLEHGRKYKVDQVVVEICFTEHGPNDNNANNMLKILRQPSPKIPICGGLRQEHIVRRGMLNPTLQIPGGGGELGGYERTYETDYVRSWIYSCIWRVDKHMDLTIAHLEWSADVGDPEVGHVGPLYSGVVLGHPGRSFWIGCKIELKLSRPWYKRYRGRSHGDDDRYTFREISVSATNSNLETVVDGLDKEISQMMGQVSMSNLASTCEVQI